MLLHCHKVSAEVSCPLLSLGQLSALFTKTRGHNLVIRYHCAFISLPLISLPLCCHLSSAVFTGRSLDLPCLHISAHVSLLNHPLIHPSTVAKSSPRTDNPHHLLIPLCTFLSIHHSTSILFIYNLNKIITLRA